MKKTNILLTVLCVFALSSCHLSPVFQSTTEWKPGLTEYFAAEYGLVLPDDMTFVSAKEVIGQDVIFYAYFKTTADAIQKILEESNHDVWHRGGPSEWVVGFMGQLSFSVKKEKRCVCDISKIGDDEFELMIWSDAIDWENYDIF